MDDKEKERFLEKNLQEKSLIGEVGHRVDPNMKRARDKFLEKENVQQNYLKQFVSYEKPSVKEFYNKYVEYDDCCNL